VGCRAGSSRMRPRKQTSADAAVGTTLPASGEMTRTRAQTGTATATLWHPQGCMRRLGRRTCAPCALAVLHAGDRHARWPSRTVLRRRSAGGRPRRRKSMARYSRYSRYGVPPGETNFQPSCGTCWPMCQSTARLCTLFRAFTHWIYMYMWWPASWRVCGTGTAAGEFAFILTFCLLEHWQLAGVLVVWSTFGKPRAARAAVPGFS
jgi:hypothetical protein